MSDQETNTVFSQITPVGRGAVATIACCGSAALTIVDRCFCTVGRLPLKDRPSESLAYGRWRMASGFGEDLVVVAHDSENIEIHCHGGNATVELISGVLAEQGMKQVAPVDFETAKCHSRWQAEVNICLGRATTQRTAEILLNQKNLLPIWVKKLRQSISSGQFSRASQEIQKILEWEDYGRHLLEPRSVVLCGQPNVGKSSLINRIAGFDRAIVHVSPGTTRDVVSQLTAIDGWPVRLLDTAGLRSGSLDRIEWEGIHKARTLIDRADGVVGVFDASLPWSQLDQQLSENPAVDLLVFNKDDIAVDSERPDGIRVAAISGDGINRFLAELIRKLIPEHPSQEQPVICLASQSGRLQACCDALSRSDSQSALDELGM